MSTIGLYYYTWCGLTALVRIENRPTGLKCAARGSLEIYGRKNDANNRTIA